jgi:hypothetical protein
VPSPLCSSPVQPADNPLPDEMAHAAGGYALTKALRCTQDLVQLPALFRDGATRRAAPGPSNNSTAIAWRAPAPPQRGNPLQSSKLGFAEQWQRDR